MDNKVFVYLVDDDDDDRDFFKEALSEIAIANEIKEFSNGVDLMSDLLHTSEIPDVAFIDLNMPLMNGEECIADIRAEEKFNDMPIIVYSTTCDEVQKENLKRLGANRYLQKPNTFSQLKLKLENALRLIQDDKAERQGSFFLG